MPRWETPRTWGAFGSGTGIATSGSWAQATSCPAGAHDSAAAVRKRTVSQASPPPRRIPSHPGRATTASAPGPRAGSGSSAAWTAAPSTVTSISPRSQARSRKSWRLWIVMRPASRSRSVALTRTGAAIAWCSQSAGFGVRSGKTTPSMQKLPSFGSSPKSPP